MAIHTPKRPRSCAPSNLPAASETSASKRRRILLPIPSSELDRDAIAAWASNVEQSALDITAAHHEINTAPHFDRTCPAQSETSISFSDSQSQPSRNDDATSTSSGEKADFTTKLMMLNVRNADAQREKPKPNNWSDLLSILRQDRTTPGATHQEQEDVACDLHRGISGQDAMESLRDTLLKKDWKYDLVTLPRRNIHCMQHVALPLDTAFNLKNPNPDISYAFRPKSFKHGSWLEKALTAQHIPVTATGTNRSYSAPHPVLWWPFAAAEAKGSMGSFAQSHLRNQHSAAVMLNNRFQLKRLAHLNLPYGRAFIFTINLTVIASVNCHWVMRDDDGDDVFWTKQLACWNLLNTDTDELNSARRGIRNIVEYGKRINFIEVQHDLDALRALLAQPSAPNQVNAVAAAATHTVWEQQDQPTLDSASCYDNADKQDNDGEEDDADDDDDDDDGDEGPTSTFTGPSHISPEKSFPHSRAELLPPTSLRVVQR